MHSIGKRIVTNIVLATVIVGALLGNSINVEAAGKNRINVRTHTPAEIRDYLNNNDDLWMVSPIEYDEQPSITTPYKAGKLTNKVQTQALAMLNAMRYIAGLEDNVKLDETYINLAQNASLISAVNNEKSHTPVKPNGMSESMYQVAYKGASESNLASGYNYLPQAIVYGWMYDGDSNKNLLCVGHRRWILNPDMGKTGFGWVYATSYVPYPAMYVLDKSSPSNETGISWPAQNMPTEFFDTNYPWSISFGTNVDASKVKVVLRNIKTNQTWHFSNASSDGYFSVDNSYCGQKGCVIFRPNRISEYQAGDIYEVTITGLGTENGYSDSASYTVNFFDWDEDSSAEQVPPEQNNVTETVPRPTAETQLTPVESFVARLYQVALNRAPEPEGLRDWSNRLTSGQACAVDIVQGILCSPEYLNKGKSNGEIVTDCYQAMLGRNPDEAGYRDWVNRLDVGMSVDAIFAGFVGSQEFAILCANYGIEPGFYYVIEARNENVGVTAFVSRLYTQALGREYDVCGLNDWTARINMNPSRENVLYVSTTGFLDSQEFVNKNLDNTEYVKVLYRTYLGREYDDDGLADWVGQLDRGENTRDGVAAGFAYSQEFTDIMAQYGL